MFWYCSGSSTISTQQCTVHKLQYDGAMWGKKKDDSITNCKTIPKPKTKGKISLFLFDQLGLVWFVLFNDTWSQ